MSLARAWRRQLYGASSAALIVPSAMLAALIVLALGGGFGQVGVLGQIFAGPAAPSLPGASLAAGHGGAAARAIPVTPLAALGAGPALSGSGRAGTTTGRGRTAPVSSRGPSRTGGAVAPVRTVAPTVSGAGPAPVASHPVPTGSASTGSVPSQPSAQPPPSTRSTPVDKIVKTVTPVTQQVPAPVGPAATQAVQTAGSAADSLIPAGVGSAPDPPPAVKLP
jgi:hypothetical protein